jgi:hypothetical protein
MEEKMNWKEKIPGCFGNDDLEFGFHQYDSERAMEMFKKAAKEDVELEEIVVECKRYLQTKNAIKSHIEKQEKIIREYCYKNLRYEE